MLFRSLVEAEAAGADFRAAKLDGANLTGIDLNSARIDAATLPLLAKAENVKKAFVD